MGNIKQKYFVFITLFTSFSLFGLYSLYLPFATKVKPSPRLVPYDEYECGCPRFGPPLTDQNNHSLCSDWSTARGSNQKVVSYTVYGNYSDLKTWRKYYSQIEHRLREVNQHYKGWILRLYHSTNEEDKTGLKALCRLYCKYPSFDPCFIGRIPIPNSWTRPPSSTDGREKKTRFQNTFQFKVLNGFLAFFDDQKSSPEKEKFSRLKTIEEAKMFDEVLVGKLWRFLPMGDRLVSVFLVRDLDSYVLPREVAAVNQWILNSSALIHSMRDHPSHNGVMLAGLWGGARWRDEELMTSFMKKILSFPPRGIWDYDQIMLSRIVWPEVLDKILIHDSYHCQNPFLMPKTKTHPFPTQRNGSLFVSWGPYRSPSERKNIVPCPIHCRPKLHMNWNYC